MNKYVRYANWLAQVLVGIAAVASAVLYFKTLDGMYLAKFGANVAVLLAFTVDDEMLELKKRIEIIESKQHGFMSFEKAIYAEQLDCKERVDALAKTMDGE